MDEPQRRIRALHTASTITVYQAYAAEIGLPAVQEGRFPAVWKRDRMTWVIKPRSQTSTTLLVRSGGLGWPGGTGWSVRRCGVIHYLRFFFEAGVNTPLWPEDMDSPYGYPCDLARLPISPQTRAELARLSEWYQSSIDWDYPPNPSPWSDEELQQFKQQALSTLDVLRLELGAGWIVRDESLL